ncbi:hypothetical protein VKT23_017767 [Stygiomarasmius scandens]|uniref:Heterokaryon incompatibility domain-containing protein n=1 Tax=Marasmiellus scandens TaxID=2682957 RepID=A0ABR1IU84_9AGAR
MYALNTEVNVQTIMERSDFPVTGIQRGMPKDDSKGPAAVAMSGIQFVRGGTPGTTHNYPLAVYEPQGDRISDNAPTKPGDFSPSTGKSIFSASLADLRAAANRDERIDLTPFATAERYRFIDCIKLVHEDTLHLWETLELPRDQYASISHVWKSLPPELDDKFSLRGVFLVDCEDRNDGGPISIDVLRYTCLVCLQAGIHLLWLDRLCILQTATVEGKRDKRWQIMKMYDIYKYCGVCFVLPAGLRRFPMKAEETEWIERAWTFQEVMVAPIVKVLYTEFVGSPPECFLHSMHIEEYFKAQQRIYDDDRDGSQERRRQFAQALDKRQQYREPTTGHVARFHDIWEYVQWRTSARPVDVVFSVMGLLGVTLDPSNFTRDDRLKATIAMAQALLLEDDSVNTCIEIPLWRRLSRSHLDTARKAGTAIRDYIVDIPARVRLQDLEQELDTQSLRRFKFATKTSVASGLEALEREKANDEDLEELKDVKAVVMGGDNADTEVRAFLARKVNSSSKSQRKADRVLTTIPSEILRRTINANHDDQRILFKTPGNLTLALCRTLSPSLPVPGEYIFGWCIESVLWVRLGRYADAFVDRGRIDPDKIKSAPIPIITFWKFHVTSRSV